MVKSGDYLVFPGGGTQFKEGVNHYTEFIEKVYLVASSLIICFNYHVSQSLFSPIHVHLSYTWGEITNWRNRKI